MIPTGRLGRAARLVGAAVGADPTAALGRLKGGAQKLGQTVALVADGMPPELREKLGTLFAQAEPRPWSEVAPVFDGLPADVRARIELDERPFAAASLGQVHRGRLDGQDVAVKLQYPGVRAALIADLDNLGTAALPARLVEGAGAVLTGLRASLLGELDLRTEAAASARMAAALAPWPRLRLARALVATEQVLVSTFLDGPTLHAVLPETGDQRAGSTSDAIPDARTLADDLVAAVLGPVFSDGIVNADAHPGNILLLPDGLGLVDFGAVTTVSDVATLDRTLTQILAGRRLGMLSGLGLEVGPLEQHVLPLLDPLGAGTWNFADDTLLRHLGEVKRRHPFTVRNAPFAPDRLALIRATLGLHHALRRLAIPFALGESLATVRRAARGGAVR